MGVGGWGPIPHSAVREFAREDGLSQHDTNVLHHVIRLLDNRQREIAAERAEKQAKKHSK